ncbi:MAG: hypothetical protein JJ913_04825 [Rhizobiaceae bacterium]|nr:hypothetical protein [Rhizobiaceae bacterium]
MLVDRLDHVQSTRILPIARALVIIAALLCLVAIAAAAIWIVILQVRTWAPVDQQPVPELPPRPAVENVELDAEAVARRLVPPSKISVTALDPLTQSTRAGTVVALVAADTANGLAPLPEGLLVLSSPDAGYFRPSAAGQGRLGLAATSALVDLVKSQLETPDGPASRIFQLRLAVRDRYGLSSAPAEVELRLILHRAQAASDERPAPPAGAQASSWQMLAQEIALAIDPSRSPAYFDAYNRALAVPQQCEVGNQTEIFTADARRAFLLVADRLASTNPEAFYDGLCVAWASAREAEAAARARIEADERAAVAARQAVIVSNSSARAEAALHARSMRGQQLISLAFVGSAVLTFLFISLVLAFLAIEGHSKAIRAAILTIATGKANEKGEPT